MNLAETTGNINYGPSALYTSENQGHDLHESDYASEVKELVSEISTVQHNVMLLLCK